MIDIRIDEKMVKGQLTNQWTRTMSGHTLLVVNDAVASNSLLSQSLLLTAPGGVRAVIKNVDDAIRILQDPRSETMTIHVLVNSLADAFKICEKAKVRSVNITMFTKGTGDKEELVYGVKLSSEEKEMVRKLAEAGIPVFNQPLPGVDPADIVSMIK